MENNCYVISVSYKAGVYRHIAIKKESLLSQLGEIILHSFDLLGEKSSVFFMNNRKWTTDASYYCKPIFYLFDDVLSDEEFIDYLLLDDDQPLANHYQLSSLIKISSKFKFIYDFGKEYSFQCKVLKETYLDFENEEKYPNYFLDSDTSSYIIKEVGDGAELEEDYL